MTSVHSLTCVGDGKSEVPVVDAEEPDGTTLPWLCSTVLHTLGGELDELVRVTGDEMEFCW